MHSAMTETLLLPLTEASVMAVARAMRAADRREVFATRFDDDPDSLARDLVAISRIGAVVAHDGRPVAAMGAIECWPGMWSVWLIATDDWQLVARATTRWARHALETVLPAAGAHRCECRSIADHETAHRWLTHLGAHAEAVHPGFGRNRETFITFAWRFDHVRNPFCAEAQSAATAAAHRRHRDRSGGDRGTPAPRIGRRPCLDAAHRRRGVERTGARHQQDAARQLNDATVGGRAMRDPARSPAENPQQS